ncbi:glycerophosphodiester phosphodiesterase family protein [Pseudodonghicola flavimaris]|uniref:Glycerophosphodiester phosphodiesterase family protein n=1 Tax=Pseudodonghicola flavimaris TaxID=3050036 RepID=A0ABT7EWC6_9RHOB|nr:glycerophosphodiester phosphodiesterase family protein [Pseudodonghicola flavimaris]MDK3016647.1 glycerophosphodiester phosphodiesterase family protein [Pseudodonghicola flavimaris]
MRQLATLPDDLLRLPVAHRALHDRSDGRPENSRAAIRAAIAAGYAIEIDLQLTADGQAVVFHDYDLKRLTAETGAVRKRTAAELEQIPLTGGDGEGIPGFDEVLALVAGQVPLLVEIKDQDGAMGPDVGPLEAAAAAALAGYDGPVAVMSFNPHSMAEMARLAPDLPRGLVTSAYDPSKWPLSPEVCDHLRRIPDFDRVEAAFISHEAADLGRARVRALHGEGVPVLCWTIRSLAAEAAARKLADNITFEGYLAAIPG